MTPTSFQIFYKHSHCILGEGAVIERLRRNSGFELDPHIVIRPSSMTDRNVSPWRPSIGSIWTSAANSACHSSFPPRPGVLAGNGSQRPVARIET